MKRKYLIIFFIILATILAFGLLMLFLGNNGQRCCGKVMPKAGQKAKDTEAAYQELVTGLWQIGTHVYYRFNADGTGHTWDTDDDLTENEASPFQWQISNGNLVLSHQMRMYGFIPRMYHIDALDKNSMQFHDAYSDYSLKRLNK